MLQTLTSSLLKVKSQQSEEHSEGAEASIKSFHQNERERQSKDPINTAYQVAVAVGKAQTDLFLKSVRDSSHIYHEKNFAMYKNKYGMDSKIVEADLIANSCKELNASPYEMADPAYEANVFKKYKPTGNITLEDAAFHNNFKQALQEKWNKVGYSGDKDFINSYTNKYGLMSNENLIDLKNFQPKN